METTAKNAIGTGAPLISTSTSAGSVMIAARIAVIMTPLAGIFLELNFDQSW